MYYNNYIIYCIILVHKSHLQYITYFPLQSIDLGLAVSISYIGCVDPCSSPMGGTNLTWKNGLSIFLNWFCIIRIIHFMLVILQADALLKTLELQESA